MNNKWRIIFASLAASLLLAACGTSDADKNSSQTDSSSGNAVEEPAENPETDVVEEQDVASENKSETEGNQADETDLLQDAVETKSDEQNYSMKVIPGFTLTSEEPGRDSLYLEEDSSVFMRIETMPKSDESFTFDELYENMGELLNASSNGETPTEVTNATALPQDEGIAQVKGLEVKSSEGFFKGFVMEREDMLIRVTIYTADDNEHSKEFTQMASTIH
ncbi:hypothetical protein [Sporosarcina obsidiansis]|uniref:hypothetical protein n=1 Tax=Sporosarcina obsidiansis TaxID=2660748 RepID=UPI00129B8EBD|nr:hypothetical protein [Sporosarcina obsidiansis]